MCDEEFGETLHLKDLGRSQRTYGTCGTIPAWSASFMSPTHSGLREWASHEVKSTETMVGIALKYDLTVEDIRRSNNLWTNDSLWPGQVLRIPLKSPTNFLSPPNEAQNIEGNSSHSNASGIATSISPSHAGCGLSGFKTTDCSPSASTLTSCSHPSSNLSGAASNSSRRTTKSSISSNLNSSSSEIGDGVEDFPISSQTGNFSKPRKKGKVPTSGRSETFDQSTSEVSASEFLSRMDMSIEATRRNLKKSSSSAAIADANFDNSAMSDTLSTCDSGRVTKGDNSKIMC